MSGLFITILNMSIAGSVVILVILLARLILKNAPKKWSYLLWIAAGFRLCCPVSIRSAISLFRVMPKAVSQSTAESAVAAMEYIPRMATKSAVTAGTQLPAAIHNTVIPALTSAPVSSAPVTAAPIAGLTSAPVTSAPIASAPIAGTTSLPLGTVTAAPTQAAAASGTASAADFASLALTVFTAVWLAGVALMLVYALVDYIRLRKRTATATLLEGNVYQSENITSPFVLGVFKPRIIVPYGLNEKELEYVLAHERYHLRRGDQIIKFFSFLLLCLHWFNPLCWLAFILMSRDMEMSCDEKVLGSIGSKAGYSSALLSFAAGKRYPAPNPLSFSETNIKERVKNAMKYKKPKLIVTITAIVLCFAVVAACVVNPKDESPKDAAADTTGEPAAEETPTPEPEITPDPDSETTPDVTPTEIPAENAVAYWPIDIDGDGAEDKFAIDLKVLFTEQYAAPYIVLADGTEVTGFEKISAAHVGVGTFAITERGGRQYVLEHHIQSYSGGHVTDRYILWTLENGSLAAAEEDEIEYNFAYGMSWDPNDIDAVIAYYERLDAVWSVSEAAVSADPFIANRCLYYDGDLHRQVVTGYMPSYVVVNNREAVAAAMSFVEYTADDFALAAEGRVQYHYDLEGMLDYAFLGDEDYDTDWSLADKLRYNNHIIEREWDYIVMMGYLGYEDASSLEIINESQSADGVWTYVFRDSATGKTYYIIGRDPATITEVSWTFE